MKYTIEAIRTSIKYVVEFVDGSMFSLWIPSSIISEDVVFEHIKSYVSHIKLFGEELDLMTVVSNGNLERMTTVFLTEKTKHLADFFRNTQEVSGAMKDEILRVILGIK